MAKLWKRYKGDDGASKVAEIDFEEIKITSPTVIFLTGLFTTDKKLPKVSGSIKHLENLLEVETGDTEHVNIWGWTHTNLRNAFNAAAYNFRPDSYASDEAKLIASKVVLPLVAKGLQRGEDGQITGEPLAPNTAKKNLRNVTFFGYSAGTVLAQQVYNASLDMMKQIGFEKTAAQDVLKDIVLVSVGNMSRPTKEGDRFTTIYMSATNDRLIRRKQLLWLSARESSIWFSKNLRIRPISSNTVYISTRVRDMLGSWKKKRIRLRDRLKMMFRLVTLRHNNHELQHYTTNDDRENAFANIAKYALTNAVKRDGRVAVQDLLQPTPALKTPQLPSASKNALDTYTTKVSGAFLREWGY